eukprot:CAMPEP_0205802620 /NCGR_PEP_ID=MMETSP0205-20121125/5013_1 /ASSEMBLY_ACC=CAM_ASM_000278 /TAXON_ID=36767 /ORGANISM="Euplotes focardii, Strain TN1" /LENGTH=238 /DNA_ID=CAMNT_0053069359 /DNA_START=583 /DNA_END=1296 /DNA_ORIENTATION=+
MFSVIRFYREKEAGGKQREEGGEKRRKDAGASVQVWSIFILMIMNEYSIGRTIQENVDGLKTTLSTTELTEVPSNKIDNYTRCSKIALVITEFLKSIGRQNSVKRDREARLFASSFIYVLNNAPERRDVIPCLLSLLRFRNMLKSDQYTIFQKIFKRAAEKGGDGLLLQILNNLVIEFDDGKRDTFGKPIKEELNPTTSRSSERGEGEDKDESSEGSNQSSKKSERKRKRPLNDPEML